MLAAKQGSELVSCILGIDQVRLVHRPGKASQKCISLVCSLFELLRFWASEDQEHFEALRTFQARWARSGKRCVLLCFSSFRDGFDAQYKAKRGSELVASQKNCYLCSKTGFHTNCF